MRRLMVIAAVVLAMAGIPVHASATAAPAVATTRASGTWFFIDRNPACPDADAEHIWEATCGWVWKVQVSGKKVRSSWYSAQANVVSTNGWAMIQDRRIKGICTNGDIDFACSSERRFTASGRPMTPAGGKRVSWATVLGLYPNLSDIMSGWSDYQRHPAASGNDPTVLEPCANNLTRVAQQLRSQGRTYVSKRTQSSWVADCRGTWAFISPEGLEGDVEFVARKIHGRWRFAFGAPATPGSTGTAPDWVVDYVS